MKKKYIFFDIDGTLTDNATKKIVPSAQKALDELQKNGHFVAIATGRAHYKAPQRRNSQFQNIQPMIEVFPEGHGCLITLYIMKRNVVLLWQQF